MTSQRPYLLRAIHDWLIDNGLTPYILVDAKAHGVNVPEEHIVEGQVVLNVSPSAVQALEMTNQEIRFNARFSGKARSVSVPSYAVKAIYARENGKGMVFAEDGEDVPPGGGAPPRKPSLKVVK